MSNFCMSICMRDNNFNIQRKVPYTVPAMYLALSDESLKYTYTIETARYYRR